MNKTINAKPFLKEFLLMFFGIPLKRSVITAFSLKLKNNHNATVNTLTMKGCIAMSTPKRQYTTDDIHKLPDFIRVTLFDGEILTDDWTKLIIDEEVFKNPPSEDHHVTCRLSVVKSE